MFIPDPDSDFFQSRIRIPDPGGQKRDPDLQHCFSRKIFSSFFLLKEGGGNPSCAAGTAGRGQRHPVTQAQGTVVTQSHPPPYSLFPREVRVSESILKGPPARLDQCCGSGSVGSICFWSSWIRFH
jgi:hypothetical protein